MSKILLLSILTLNIAIGQQKTSDILKEMIEKRESENRVLTEISKTSGYYFLVKDLNDSDKLKYLQQLDHINKQIEIRIKIYEYTTDSTKAVKQAELITLLYTQKLNLINKIYNDNSR